MICQHPAYWSVIVKWKEWTEQTVAVENSALQISSHKCLSDGNRRLLCYIVLLGFQLDCTNKYGPNLLRIKETRRNCLTIKIYHWIPILYKLKWLVYNTKHCTQHHFKVIYSGLSSVHKISKW